MQPLMAGRGWPKHLEHVYWMPIIMKLVLGGGALASLEQIDFGGLDPRLKKVNIQIASDVISTH